VNALEYVDIPNFGTGSRTGCGGVHKVALFFECALNRAVFSPLLRH
jgi:hypothetical protein